MAATYTSMLIATGLLGEAMTTTPKYSIDQRVIVNIEWARRLGAIEVERVVWDEAWGCYTYALKRCRFLIGEHDLILARPERKGEIKMKTEQTWKLDTGSDGEDEILSGTLEEV